MFLKLGEIYSWGAESCRELVFFAISVCSLVSQVLGPAKPRGSRLFCGLHPLVPCWDAELESIGLLCTELYAEPMKCFLLFPITQGQKLRLGITTCENAFPRNYLAPRYWCWGEKKNKKPHKNSCSQNSESKLPAPAFPTRYMHARTHQADRSSQLNANAQKRG